MSRRDDTVSLKDMLDYAREAVEMLGYGKPDELTRNRMLQLALTRLVECIGEAANRVSQEARSRHTDLPWPKIIGMRNRLIHGYDIVDLDLLYHTILTDLSSLIEALERIVDDGTQDHAQR